MVSVKQLASKLGIPLAYTEGSLELINFAHVDKILTACEEKNIYVLGIEGFKKDGKSIIPEMDFIADYSALDDLPLKERSAKSIESARGFFKEAASKPEMLFEFNLKG